MPTVDFLPFATSVGANVETQATYAADPTTGAGFATGTAISASLNKVWRQSAFMAAVIANWVSGTLAANVLDDGNLAAHVTQFNNAILALLAPYAPLASPALTGSPTAPTVAGTSDSSTKIATTAFVQAVAALLAPRASPAFTGTPTAPTPTASDNSTKIATTAFVQGHAAPLVKLYASGQQTFTSNSAVGPFTHGLSLVSGAQAWGALVCQTAEHNYSVGDVVEIVGDLEGTAGLNIWYNATQVGALIASNSVEILDKSTFAKFPVTAANWKLVIFMQGN